MQKTTDNKSVRFNKEQFDYVCLKEKLTTPQSVVNFLLQDYWIKNEIVPKFVQVQNMVAAQNLDYSPPVYPKPTPTRTFQDYMNEIPKLEYEPEYRKLWGEIQASTLSDKQKQLLKINMSKSGSDAF